MRLINAAPLSSDDRSNQKERILIGVIGLALPLVLYLLNACRPEFPSSRWTLLRSKPID
jgi:hypothetical protein